MTINEASDEVQHALVDALAASGTGTWRWDATTGIVTWDATLEALSGLLPGSFGSTFDAWKATLYPDEVDGIMAQVEAAIERRGSYHFEHRTIWPDGSIHWLECRGQVTTDALGTFTGTVGCAVDVTERHRVEQERVATLERERRLRDRFQFLSQLSERAISADEHLTFMRFAAAAAVPKLGDWCSIHFVPEPGEPIEIVVADADPAKVEWADALARRFPYSPSGLTGVPKVIRTGTTDFIERVTPEFIDDALAAVEADTTELRRVIDELALSSVITVPLVTKRGVLGAMQFVNAESGLVYDHDDVALAEMAARRIADAVDNLWLTEQHQHISATLQRALLPPAIPSIPGIDLAVRYYPAGAAVAAGGDFYDVFQVGPDAWSLLIGDVCGTGPDAAALTGITRHTTRAAARHGQDHTSILEWLNQAMLLSNRDRFCTATYGTLTVDPEGWVLTTCAAGHPRPVVVRADGTTEVLGCSGTLLGVFDSITLRPATTRLAEGDLVVLYTDGLTDLPPPNARTETELASFVGDIASGCSSASELAERIRRDLVDDRPAGARDDDVALVVLVVTGPPPDVEG